MALAVLTKKAIITADRSVDQQSSSGCHGPEVIMMVSGLYAFETLVYFNQGEIFKALAAGVLVGFAGGAIAFGLAAARFISEPEWLRE